MREKNSFALDGGAALEKEIAQFIGVEPAVVLRIQGKKDFAAGAKMLAKIVEEEIPFARAPKRLVGVTVESDGESGDPIEFAAEIGQRFEGFDPPDFSFETEKIDQVAEKRERSGIQTETTMAEPPADEQKESGAAAKIENLLGRRAIELQILHAFDVGFEPILDIGVLGLVRGGIGIARFDFTQAAAVDPGEKGWQENRMKLALKTPPGAPVGFALKDFPEFVRSFHAVWT